MRRSNIHICLKTQERAIFHASGVMYTQITLLSQKTWHSEIIECFWKDRAMKEAV